MSDLQRFCCGPNNDNCGCVQHSNQYPYLGACECNNLTDRIGLGYNCKHGEIPYFEVIEGKTPDFDTILNPMCGFKVADGETDPSKCPPAPPGSGPVVIRNIPHFGSVCALRCHTIPGGPDHRDYSDCPHDRPTDRPTRESFTLQSRDDPPPIPIYRPDYMQCNGNPPYCYYMGGYSEPNQLMGIIRTGISVNPGNVGAGRNPACVPGGDDASKVQDCISCVKTNWGEDCKNSQGVSCDYLSLTTPRVTDKMVRNFCTYGMRGQASN